MKQGITLCFALLLGGCGLVKDSTESSGRQAWKSCIQQSNGEGQKVKACQPQLDTLQLQQQHRVFARRETVRVLDYQRCLDAEKMGGGEGVSDRCGQLWQEIKHANQ